MKAMTKQKEETAMMQADKLRDLLQQAQDEANRYLDSKAEALAATTPGVPVGVIRQTLCRGNCPCSYALNLIDSENGK